MPKKASTHPPKSNKIETKPVTAEGVQKFLDNCKSSKSKTEESAKKTEVQVVSEQEDAPEETGEGGNELHADKSQTDEKSDQEHSAGTDMGQTSDSRDVAESEEQRIDPASSELPKVQSPLPVPSPTPSESGEKTPPAARLVSLYAQKLEVTFYKPRL